MNSIYRSATTPPRTQITPEDEMRLALLKGDAPAAKVLVAGRVLLLVVCIVAFACGERPYFWTALDLALIASYGWPLVRKWRLERRLARGDTRT